MATQVSIKEWEQIVAAQPRRADAWLELAIARLRASDPYRSASAARRAIELQPDLAAAHAQLGLALAAIGQHEQAASAARRASELQPDSHERLNDLGYVLRVAGQLDEAAGVLRRAIALRGDIPAYHLNLAATLDRLDDVDGALAAARRAVELGVQSPDIFNNMAMLCRRGRDDRAAVEYADRALRLQLNHAAAHGTRALALLTLGDYAGGFAEYEWRWRCASFTTPRREFARPMWDGSDPRGRTIFVHAEQGFGDVIQFARYVPMLAARGARVVLEVDASLQSLMKRLRGEIRIVVKGLQPPDFDLHAPLLSLPRAFATTIETIPADVPYLHADPARLPIDATAGLRVGLVWWGNTKPDPNRSCPLPVLEPLARVPNVTFYSLQKGDVPRDAAVVPQGMRVIDLSRRIRDFADTASAMAQLDLIISIDTAAAHLAGALARPAWVLLPWSPDWRWMLDRCDSPWYPTMRLFRQEQRGDWTSVAQRLAQELTRYSESRV